MIGYFLLLIGILSIVLSIYSVYSMWASSTKLIEGCPEDAWMCPDGSSVVRVLPDCEFEDCPSPVACTMDAKVCPDGSTVGRSGPNCEFEECPDDYCAMIDIPGCLNGRQPKIRSGTKCDFYCPEEEAEETEEHKGGDQVICAMDVKECPDGSYVSRSGPNCEFKDCPVEEITVDCNKIPKKCKNGVIVYRIPPTCEYETCPVISSSYCTKDVMMCADGSYVGRVPPECNFATCPQK